MRPQGSFEGRGRVSCERALWGVADHCAGRSSVSIVQFCSRQSTAQGALLLNCCDSVETAPLRSSAVTLPSGAATVPSMMTVRML